MLSRSRSGHAPLLRLPLVTIQSKMYNTGSPTNRKLRKSQPRPLCRASTTAQHDTMGYLLYQLTTFLNRGYVKSSPTLFHILSRIGIVPGNKIRACVGYLLSGGAVQQGNRGKYYYKDNGEDNAAVYIAQRVTQLMPTINKPIAQPARCQARNCQTQSYPQQRFPAKRQPQYGKTG